MEHQALAQAAPLPADVAAMAATLMQVRQTILPKRLGSPGPDAQQLECIVGAAAHAPDHGQLLPWRFVLVPQAQRTRLADVFADALRERDAAALPEQIEQAREKAFRSPVLLLAVVDGLRGDPEVDLYERLISSRMRRAEHAADGHGAGFWFCADERQGAQIHRIAPTVSACRTASMPCVLSAWAPCFHAKARGCDPARPTICRPWAIRRPRGRPLDF
jgi:nitroreductase